MGLSRAGRGRIAKSCSRENPQGLAPSSIWEVLGRQKNIQYASRAESHIARQKQLHRMRHIIRSLKHRLPPEALEDPDLVDLTAHGCGTTMHVVRLLAPALDGDDYTKDIDFSSEGMRSRRAPMPSGVKSMSLV